MLGAIGYEKITALHLQRVYFLIGILQQSEDMFRAFEMAANALALALTGEVANAHAPFDGGGDERALRLFVFDPSPKPGCEDDCPPSPQPPGCEDACPPSPQPPGCEDACPPSPQPPGCED